MGAADEGEGGELALAGRAACSSSSSLSLQRVSLQLEAAADLEESLRASALVCGRRGARARPTPCSRPAAARIVDLLLSIEDGDSSTKPLPTH